MSSCTWYVAVAHAHRSLAMLLFSKLNKTFIGYFDPEKIFQDNENRMVLGVTCPLSWLQKKHWSPIPKLHERPAHDVAALVIAGIQDEV